MTKDEILKENGACLHDEAYQYSCDTEDLRNAMDQYAKQQCIQLLNWMFAGAAETIPYPGPNMWLRDLSDEYKDSEAFHYAFLTEYNKK